MHKTNFGEILKENQMLSTLIKYILILLLPLWGELLDKIISNAINGDTLFNTFNLKLFVFVGWALLGYIIYKKFKNWSKISRMRYVKNGLKQTILNNSQLYLEKNKQIVGPIVKVEEDNTDIFLHFQMPYGLSKENYKKNKDLFENVFGYSVMKVNETQTGLTFHFKKAEKDLSTDYLYENQDAVILGYDTYSEPVWWEPLKEPHLIVAASSGGGKTVYLQSIVLQLKNITDNLTFVDFKGNEFGPLEDEGYKVHTDLEGVLDTLRAFNAGMKDRARQLKENRLRDYTQLGLEPSFLIFDEYSELISMFPNDKEGKAEKAEFEKLLGSIARLGRSAGYYVILSMQQPNANTLSTEIRDNIGKKVAIKGANSTIQTMIYGERVSEIDTNLDYGNHIINTGAGYEVVKVPYYDGDFFGDMAKA